MKILSEYPLGLFRTWTNLQFPITLIIYPEPLPCTLPNAALEQLKEDDGHSHQSTPTQGDDFYELAAYQRGYPLSQVAWKQVAKGQAWQVKRYANHVQPSENSLSLMQMPGQGIETKLRHLCYVVLEHNQANIPFALDLGQSVIPIDAGDAHLKNCLWHMACYGHESQEYYE